ncbi:MAG: hypothetical protein J6U05_00475 [Neisseriaceae bacterium]|nr:hypothetical protein [Neisseriaceae bacterium]
MSNEQWALCFALRQNNLFVDNASILFLTLLSLALFRFRLPEKYNRSIIQNHLSSLIRLDLIIAHY